MVRDGANAPPHHEGRAFQPPPFSDIDGGGAFGAGVACDGVGAERARSAAETGKARRILRHHAGLDRGQRKAAAFVQQPRPLAGTVRVAGISQRADPDLAVSRLWRPVGPAARPQGRAFHRHQRQGRLVHRPHRLSRAGDDRRHRRRGLADARARRQTDHRARLVRTRSRSRSMAPSSMSASSASTSCCVTIFPRVLPARSARSCRCRRRRAGCPSTRGWKGW